jgi:hypothetical protein
MGQTLRHLATPRTGARTVLFNGYLTPALFMHAPFSSNLVSAFCVLRVHHLLNVLPRDLLHDVYVF